MLRGLSSDSGRKGPGWLQVDCFEVPGAFEIPLQTRISIISVVLTPQRFHEHDEHRDFFFRHFRLTGAEAAQACAAAIAGIRRLRELAPAAP